MVSIILLPGSTSMARFFGLYHAPEPVPGALVVPLRGGLKIAGAGQQMLPDHLLVQSDAKAGLVRSLDESLVDDGLLDAFHHVLPPRHVQRVVFAGQEILRGGGAVNTRQGADGGAGIVHGHGYAQLHSRFADFVRLQDSAGSGNVRMDLADGVLLTQVDEVFFQVDILTGPDRRGAVIRDVLQHVGILPRNHIFHPGKVELLVSLPQPDDGVHAQVAEVIHGRRNLHADGLARGLHILGELLDALFGHLGGDEGVRQRSLLPRAHFRRLSHRAGNALHQVDAHVHLQPGEAHLLLAGFQALCEDVRVRRFVRVGVNSDAVAELAAQHLVDGHVVHFAGDIPEGLFDGYHATGLPAMEAELFDLLEEIGDVERVLIQQAAFQKQRIGGAGAVADFSQSIDALVGVEADDGARAWPGLRHDRHAKVGDLERGGARAGVDVSLRRLFGRGFPRQERAAHDPGRGLEQIPPSYLATAFEHNRPPRRITSVALQGVIGGVADTVALAIGPTPRSPRGYLRRTEP